MRQWNFRWHLNSEFSLQLSLQSSFWTRFDLWSLLLISFSSDPLVYPMGGSLHFSIRSRHSTDWEGVHSYQPLEFFFYSQARTSSNPNLVQSGNPVIGFSATFAIAWMSSFAGKRMRTIENWSWHCNSRSLLRESSQGIEDRRVDSSEMFRYSSFTDYHQCTQKIMLYLTNLYLHDQISLAEYSSCSSHHSFFLHYNDGYWWKEDYRK